MFSIESIQINGNMSQGIKRIEMKRETIGCRMYEKGKKRAN